MPPDEAALGRGKENRSMNRVLILTTLVLAMVAAALGAAGPADSKAPAPAAPPAYTEDVFTQPSMTIDLAAAVGGIVRAVDADEGAIVKAGDPIIRLDDSTEAVALRAAQLAAEDTSEEKGALATLEQAKYEAEVTAKLALERVEAQLLAKQKQAAADVAAAKYEGAKRARERAGLELEAAKISLARRTIKAPVRCLVTRMPKHPGEAVQPLETVGQLSVTDPLHILIHPPARLLGTFRVGQTLPVEILEPKRETITAKVEVVNEVVEPASNTFRVRLAVPNADGHVSAGVKVRVTVAGPESLKPAKP
jgi:membrane fusion protein, heavy metal efflux system